MHFTKKVGVDKWSVVYDRAIRDDGSLFFPERHTRAYLNEQKRVQGSYIFANQYLNRIIPTENQTFKKEWFKYYKFLPSPKNTFAFLDPAISDQEGSDYTALAVVDIDCEGTWYLRVARRARLTVTQQLSLVFKVQEMFQCNAIGVEDVAYQKALIQLIDEEMRKRGIVVPVKGIKRGPDKSKESRIRSLVPRIEWGRLLLNQGLDDFEMELLKFPRGAHDDIIDAVQSIEDISWIPNKEKEVTIEPGPNSPDYEKGYIQQLNRESNYADDFI